MTPNHALQRTEAGHHVFSVGRLLRGQPPSLSLSSLGGNMDHAAFQAALVGKTVHRLVAQEHWHDGSLSDRFNVLFVLVSDRWLRFFIDAGVFFWSAVSAPNPPPTADDHQYLLAEHPFAGTVQDVAFSSSADSAELRIVLSNGCALCLHNEADQSTVTFLPPNHTLQRTEVGGRAGSEFGA